MKTIDLHVHSCCSDGSFTPEELVALAQSAGLSAFALTDHDTTDGIGQALLAAEGSGLEVVPGIEFSTRWLHRDIHILGYYIDYRAQSFQETLHGFLAARDVRNRQMCERIRARSSPARIWRRGLRTWTMWRHGLSPLTNISASTLPALFPKPK